MCISGGVCISGQGKERSSGELDEQHHKYLALKRVGAGGKWPQWVSGVS